MTLNDHKIHIDLRNNILYFCDSDYFKLDFKNADLNIVNNDTISLLIKQPDDNYILYVINLSTCKITQTDKRSIQKRNRDKHLRNIFNFLFT